MTGLQRQAPGTPPARAGSPRRRRIATWTAVVLAVVVWNGVFDWHVASGAEEYLRRQEEARVTGARVEVDELMRAAVRRGVLVASTCALAAAALPFGLLVISRQGWRSPRRDRAWMR